MQTIPLVDVQAEYAPLIPRLEAAFREVLDGRAFIRGPHYWAFQEEAAAYLGVKRAIGVANGTDALVLALDALGVGPGDEVICPAFTFYATAESIARRGATPVFADIDPVTLNLDVGGHRGEGHRPDARDHARPPLRPPDATFGRSMELGVPVIEDAAQAFGAPGVAQHGTSRRSASIPTKNLFCLGDGGLVATNDEELADRVQMLSFHGSRDKIDFDFVGYNSRLDELQAALLRIFLPAARRLERGRREAAARYAELGLGELVELPQDEPGHIYHLFVCRSPERDRIRAALTEAGIASATYYTTPLHLQPALRFLGYEPGSLPETEQAASENFSCRSGRGSRPRRRSASSTSCAPPSSAVESDAPASVAAPAVQLLSTRRSSRSRGVLAFELRFDHGLPVYYDSCFIRTILLVVVIKLAVFLALRLLQPLVALRLGARHVERRARRRRRVARRRPHGLLRRAGARRPPAALDRGAWTCCSRSRSSRARACSRAR